MKKLNLIPVVVLLFLSTFFTGCKEDETPIELPLGAFEHGVIIVNEGNFLDADGSLSFYDQDDNEVINNVYSQANNGAALGDVVQSVWVHDNKAYIIVNNSNKIEVVNSNTMEKITSIQANYPRYMTVANGKGYVTQWGENFGAPSVLVIDLSTNAITKTISTEAGSEQIVTANNKVYVSNNWTNSISVIDPFTDAIKTTIITDYYGISGLTIDANNNVWGVYEGSSDWTTGEEFNDGAFVRVNTADDFVDLSLSLEMNIGRNITMDATRNVLLYYKGTNAYAVNVSATEFEAIQIIDEPNAISFYGIGVDPSNGDIYLADSKGFQGNGSIYRYSLTGTKIESFDAGRGPNGFVFK